MSDGLLSSVALTSDEFPEFVSALHFCLFPFQSLTASPVPCAPSHPLQLPITVINSPHHQVLLMSCKIVLDPQPTTPVSLVCLPAILLCSFYILSPSTVPNFKSPMISYQITLASPFVPWLDWQALDSCPNNQTRFSLQDLTSSMKLFLNFLPPISFLHTTLIRVFLPFSWSSWMAIPSLLEWRSKNS